MDCNIVKHKRCKIKKKDLCYQLIDIVFACFVPKKIVFKVVS